MKMKMGMGMKMKMGMGKGWREMRKVSRMSRRGGCGIYLSERIFKGSVLL
jgi:hypothetical protein